MMPEPEELFCPCRHEILRYPDGTVRLNVLFISGPPGCDLYRAWGLCWSRVDTDLTDAGISRREICRVLDRINACWYRGMAAITLNMILYKDLADAIVRSIAAGLLGDPEAVAAYREYTGVEIEGKVAMTPRVVDVPRCIDIAPKTRSRSRPRYKRDIPPPGVAVNLRPTWDEPILHTTVQD